MASVAAVAVLGLATGCAGDGPRPAAARGPVVEGKGDLSAVKVLSGVQLRHAELGPGEVAGFQIEKASPGSAGGGRPSTDSPPCRPLVVALGSQPQPEPAASVVNTFSKGTREEGFQGLLGMIRISSYAGDGAATTLGELRSAAARCAGGFRMKTGEGQAQRFEAVRMLPAPKVGDEAVAYRLDNAVEEAPSLVTVVRTGSTLSMFFATNLTDPGAVEIPERLVAAQVAKVEKLERAEQRPTAPPPHPAPGGGEGGEAGESSE